VNQTANQPNTVKDFSRKWMWLFLACIAASQLYFVRELLAAFALFILVFAVIASLIAAVYMAQKSWEAGVARLMASRHPVVLAMRRAVSTVEDWGRRPLRRPGSQPAH
jgi:amino acid permease